MKKALIVICLILFISACTTKSAQTPFPATTETSTATNVPTASVTPQPSPTATQDYSADYQKVQADPWTATDEEKSGYDAYVRQQLAAKGIKNAGTLSDYDLLEAVIAYQQVLIAKGGLENPEDYLVELPISLHILIRTDRNNLMIYHDDVGRTRGYGVGNEQLTEGLLQSELNTFTGFSVYGKKLLVYTTSFSMVGEMVFLYRTPGIDPSVGVGMVLRMYNGNDVAYTEIFIPTSTAPISPGDLCLHRVVGTYESTIACPTGTQRKQGALRGYRFNWDPATLKDLLQTMDELKNPNILVTIPGDNNKDLWSDGIEIIDNIKFPTDNVLILD